MLGSFISRHGSLAWTRWEDASQLGASSTARALSQLHNFKTVGLQSAAHEYMQGMRATENRFFQKASVLIICRVLFCKYRDPLPRDNIAETWKP